MSKRFATTRWTLVLTAREGPSTAAREALASLCEAYWGPLYAFVRRQGYRAEDASDLTQAYFARLLEKRFLDAVHPLRGRFRSFLLVSLRHFLSDERDRARALKRGGGKALLSLDAGEAERSYRIEPVDHLTPETVFERRWAQTVVDRAMDRLREHQGAAGKERRFERLGELLAGTEPGARYREVAAELGMSEGALKVAVHRLRQRFGALLREEVAETVARPEQIDDELRHLLAVLQGTD